MKQTVQEIIDQIDKIVKPEWKFDMDDFYGDKGNIHYPTIESLDILFWKRNTKGIKISKLLQEDENKQIEMIKNLSEIKSVEIIKIQAFGKYIQVELDSINNRLIDKYDKYLLFKQNNFDNIYKIYKYLNEKVPEDIIGWDLFNKN